MLFVVLKNFIPYLPHLGLTKILRRNESFQSQVCFEVKYELLAGTAKECGGRTLCVRGVDGHFWNYMYM